ncbi:MAG TPA: glycosyltransferase family 39 protein [Candidatus Sulfotelmatobacter sp.]|nr:glycosyltransferase family 39 protein [Candidatus Sulfotelmatobacter sp.]
MADSDKDNRIFAAALALAALAGIFLRCYLLQDQVFGDDEWHGLYFAIGRSPAWLLTHFSIPGATCIPLNFYTGVLGAATGWSETLLRLPSLIFGILCVVVCPLVARPIIGTRQAAWLALLLAISPALIFYSRIARPYSTVAFLGFLCVLSAARWARSGECCWLWLYVASGILAVYFHLFAVVTVMTPVLAAVICSFLVRFSGKPWQVSPPVPAETEQRAAPVVPTRHWIIAGVVIVIFSGVLMAPAVIHLLETKFYNVAFAGDLRLASLPRVAMLWAGVAQPVLVVLFFAALVTGAFVECRRNLYLGIMLIGLFPLHALALLLSRPDSVQSAIVLVRYSIPLAPVCLLLVACGIQAALEGIATRVRFHASLQALVAFAFVVALSLAGPLPQCYVVPNNFTSHGAYQHDYRRIDWNHSFHSDFAPAGFTLKTVIDAKEVSPFYKFLGQHPDGRPIVEYPMMIGDHFNPLYYYQHFHGRPVLVGYATDVVLPAGLSPGNIYGDTYIDQVLSLVHDPSRLRFHNLVSMDDLPAMRARNVEFIVLHKHFEAQLDAVAMPLPDIPRLYNKYHAEIGAPVYEDAHIAVFGLTGAQQAK